VVVVVVVVVVRPPLPWCLRTLSPLGE